MYFTQKEKKYLQNNNSFILFTQQAKIITRIVMTIYWIIWFVFAKEEGQKHVR